MAATMNNVTLTPGGGWTALTSANIASFLRLSKFPSHVPVYLTVSAVAPTGAPTGGFRWDSASTHFYGAITGNVYARLQNNANGNVTVSVFAN